MMMMMRVKIHVVVGKSFNNAGVNIENVSNTHLRVASKNLFNVIREVEMKLS